MGFSQLDIKRFQSNLGIYKDEYNKYSVGIDKHDDDRQGRFISFDYNDELFNIKLFESLGAGGQATTDKIYVIVPSLFNSAQILDFSAENSFVELLRDKGDVYLLNWQEVSSQYKLSEYINAVTKLLHWLNASSESKITLVGHCIGGNIALCAAGPLASKLESIILLTTPWDFSHLRDRVRFALEMGAFDTVHKSDVVPALYVKALFFLLFPGQFSCKLDKYFAATGEEKLKLMQIEHWLHSGIALPNSLFFQIIEEVVIGNYFAKGKDVSDFCLQNITCPVLNVLAQKDRLAPKGSSISFISQLPRAESLLLRGGHISYLTGGDCKLTKMVQKFY